MKSPLDSLSIDKINKEYFYIVDTSYIIFCAAAVAFNDYVMQEDILDSKLGPDFDPTLDPEFDFIFEEKLISKIESQCKVANPFVFKRQNIIFAIDCPRAEIWRRKIYPEYKLTRDTADRSKNKFDIGKMFAYAYNQIIPKYCSETNAKIIKCTSAESDDIIAVLSRWLTERSPDNHVVILSSDRDMVQLHNDRVSILATKNIYRDPKSDIMHMCNTKKLDCDITADDFLLFKIIIGDGSDNIPSIKRLLGPKKALTLVMDKTHESLKKLLTEDETVKEAFLRNKKLISMNMIPKELQELIVENIEEEFSSSKVKTDDGEIDLDTILGV